MAMKTSQQLLIVASLALCAGWQAFASPFESSTPVQDEPVLGDALEVEPEPSIDLAKMLAGVWREQREGSAGPAHVEEIWSAPQGDNVMGCFRWVAPDGKASMYELLAITAQEDGLFLRLRHFGADLGAWEERDAPKTLRLVEHGPGRLVFAAHEHCADLASVTYDRSEPDVLAIEVAFVSESSRAPLRFRLRRAE